MQQVLGQDGLSSEWRHELATVLQVLGKIEPMGPGAAPNLQSPEATGPLGTLDAADTMMAKAREENRLGEQSTIDALRAELQACQDRDQQLSTVFEKMELDLESEDESVAPSESGEAGELKAKKRSEILARREVRMGSVKEIRKVTSKGKWLQGWGCAGRLCDTSARD